MKNIPVWDLFVRLFHWSLVLGFVLNALVLDEEGTTHQWIGYAVVALVLTRILWGFVGPRFARFASFWPTRNGIVSQIADIASRRRRAHLGHTPLGAVMIFNLLGTMLLIGLTGYMMTTDAFWGIEWVAEAHETLVGWAWVSIALHVLAVIFESMRLGINLPRAMITGRKSVPNTVTIEE